MPPRAVPALLGSYWAGGTEPESGMQPEVALRPTEPALGAGGPLVDGTSISAKRSGRSGGAAYGRQIAADTPPKRASLPFSKDRPVFAAATNGRPAGEFSRLRRPAEACASPSFKFSRTASTARA